MGRGELPKRGNKLLVVRETTDKKVTKKATRIRIQLRTTTMEPHQPKNEDYVLLGPISTIVVGLLAVAVGIFLAFVFSYASITQGAASESWPTVEGTITSSSISEVGPRDNLTYQAHVSYQYEVNEKKRHGDRVDFNSSGMSSSRRVYMQEIVRKYPSGKKVTISYDPTDPNVCVLEPGVKLGAAFLIGLVCVGIGGLVLVSGLVAAFRKAVSGTPD